MSVTDPADADPSAAGWRDNPEAYLAGDRRRALAAGQTLPDRVRGSALFADLSGFTPLTEALQQEHGRTRGAEALTAVLATVFNAVLGQLHRHGGSVVYFSGDAVTCWLDGDDGTLAASCALAMQQAMADVAEVRLPSGQTRRIGLKVAVATGRARRFVVGDPDIQLIDVLAGRLVDDLAGAESVATEGEVVVDESTLDALGDALTIAEVRTGSGRRVGVLTALRGSFELPPPPVIATGLSEEQVRPWLLPAVWERLQTGRGEFLAELRPAIPMFIRFAGLDFDNDPDARERLDEFVVAAQRVIDSYGGAALQLTLGDKGAYLYAVFGAPIAHEDDAARACAAALDLLGLTERTAVAALQIGVAQGRLRSGTYGHPHRRTFCCLGDAVNLAARLMGKAAPGHAVVADAVRIATEGRFAWEPLPPMTVKGKREPVVAHDLLGRHQEPTQRVHENVMVGRRAELEAVATVLSAAAAGRGGIVGIRAEAGVGKSRLIAEATATSPAVVYHGEAQPFGTRISYFAWQTIWADLLALTHVPPHQRSDAVTAAVADLAPDAVERAPLLGAVLATELPDTDLTGSLDPKLRKTSLESLLVQLLTAITQARGPLVIVLEDCHWLDPLSADLLEVVARTSSTLPIAVVLAYRDGPADQLPWLAALTALPGWREVVLAELDADSARAVVSAEARRLFDRHEPLPEPVVDLVLDRSGGNPFHIQELLAYLAAQAVDPADARAVSALEVPESLHALVLSRIDMLTERVRRTAKVGSVIGRQFDQRTMTGSYPAVGGTREIRADAEVLKARDLVVDDDPDLPSWVFRHAVVRDVAYDSLPFALRATLHEAVARWLESEPAADGAARRRLDLMAHHYWYSDAEDKKREYLVRAGDAAAEDFANAVALVHYERAAGIGSESQRAEASIKLGRVRELVGDWLGAETSLRAARELVPQDRGVVATVTTGLAELARKQGRFEEAATGFARARDEFAALADAAGEGRVLHLLGTLAAQRGHYDQARERYGESLRIRRRLGDRTGEAALLSNLAIVAEYEEDLAGSRELNEQALELRREIGDRWGLGISQNNLGMIALLQHDPAAARQNFLDAIAVNMAIGDPWMIAIARNNLANAELRLGDLAASGRAFSEALAAYTNLDDQWALAILYDDLSGLALALGRAADAAELVGASDAVREVIDSPRSGAQQTQAEAALSAATTDIGPDDVTRLRARGRSAGPDEVAALCRAVCSVTEDIGR